jgi:hypothetical protein
MSGEVRREQEYAGLYVNYVLSFWLTCMPYEGKGEQRAMVNGEFFDQLKASFLQTNLLYSQECDLHLYNWTLFYLSQSNF